MNHFLKFPDEATAISLMGAFRVDGAWDFGRVDPFGTVRKPGPNVAYTETYTYPEWVLTGNMIEVRDEEGNVVSSKPEMVLSGNTVTVRDQVREQLVASGWHCNLMCDSLPAALVPYEIFPANPVRVWA